MDKIPVIMFHSVGVQDEKWINNQLTYPYKKFENVLRWLKKHHYHTISFKELGDYIFNNKPVPEKSIVLTFDDGYLDNYVFAYPLLMKYGFKGCIFVSTDFISDGPKRKKLTDIDDISNLETAGYLHWSELQEMEQSGVIEIQSHAASHTFYPVNDNLIDFRHPEDGYYWMTWNENKNKKPSLFYDNEQLIKFGEPVFTHKPSLASKRFIPNVEINIALNKYVENNGGANFFENIEWKTILNNIYLKELDKQKGISGYYESEEEYEERIFNELKESKEILEEKLNKKVEVLCWPHGSATKLGVEIANRLGYRLNTAGRDILNFRDKIPNSPEYKTNRIYRISPGMYWNGKNSKSAISVYPNGWQFGVQINIYRYKGVKNLILRIFNKLLKKLYKLYFEI